MALWCLAVGWVQTMAQDQEQGPLEGADHSGGMASDPGKEEMQPHMCIHTLCSMRLRTGRDFELSSAFPLSHTKPQQCGQAST